MRGESYGVQTSLLASLRRSWAALPLRVKQFVLLLAALLVASAPGVYWAFQAATWFEQREVAVVEQQTKQFLASVSYGWLNQTQSARTTADQDKSVAELFDAIRRSNALRVTKSAPLMNFRRVYVVLPEVKATKPVVRLPADDAAPPEDDSPPAPSPNESSSSPFSDLLQSPTKATLPTLDSGTQLTLEFLNVKKALRLWHWQGSRPPSGAKVPTALTAAEEKWVGRYALAGGVPESHSPLSQRRLVGIPLDNAPPSDDEVGHLGRGWLIAEPDAMTASASYRSVMIPATMTFFLALAVAILLGIVLQRVVVTPVQSLSAKMGQVAMTGDYSVRVPETRFDELGQLQTGFNRMIARVEELTAGLEARVAERTTELDRANRELQRSNQDLDRFAYTVSHDLQEPLRNVTNIVHRLRSEWGHQLDPEIIRQIDAVDQQCDREMKMVQRILFISKLGRGELQRQPVDLQATLTQILDGLRTSMEERGVVVEIVPPLPVVYGDVILLGEVLRNLLSNAAKYNDKPQRRIRVKARSFRHHETTVIAVQDNGIGIRPQHLKKVFNLFTPLHDKRKFSETIGAGMAITKRIVERHRGKIRVVSAYGQGTSFFVRLPTMGATSRDPTASDASRSTPITYRPPSDK